ncbi:MAG: class I SAM-dependent methyltransferase [Candidatus Pacebacteria bacterium]|nr:class I SAM-dependent methyltransferase [Candidatus Paceibacterota bacterium]
MYRNQGNIPLLDLLSPAHFGAVLDIGCGAGDNARILAVRGWSVDGITLSQAEQESARLICSDVWVHDLDTGLPDETAGPYDVAVLSHVLEHLRNPEALLCRVRKILKPGGKIAVALPNILNWHQRLLFLFGRFEYTDQGIMDITHIRFYTFSSARRMIEACGYNVVRAKASGSILPWGPLRKAAPLLTSSVDRLFCWISPGLFGRQLLYLACAK